MIYIIDANNLAGQLGILKDKDFEDKLIDLVSVYFNKKNNKVYLVFDPVDRLGDKKTKGDITIIFTSKNYESADDRIIRLIAELVKKTNDEIKAISNDSEIKKEASRLNDSCKNSISTMDASAFAARLSRQGKAGIGCGNGQRGLSAGDADKISKELEGIWS